LRLSFSVQSEARQLNGRWLCLLLLTIVIISVATRWCSCCRHCHVRNANETVVNEAT